MKRTSSFKVPGNTLKISTNNPFNFEKLSWSLVNYLPKKNFSRENCKNGDGVNVCVTLLPSPLPFLRYLPCNPSYQMTPQKYSLSKIRVVLHVDISM